MDELSTVSKRSHMQKDKYGMIPDVGNAQKTQFQRPWKYLLPMATGTWGKLESDY
jgi:hypothetical protein